MNVSTYLARIEYEGTLELTLELLSAFHYAHLLSVPLVVLQMCQRFSFCRRLLLEKELIED